MTLADAADRRVARHLAGILGAEGEQADARAAASRGGRGLAAGMAGADHQNVVHARALSGSVFHVEQHAGYLPRQKRPNSASRTSSTPARPGHPIERDPRVAACAPQSQRNHSHVRRWSPTRTRAAASCSAWRRFRAIAPSAGSNGRANILMRSAAPTRPCPVTDDTAIDCVGSSSPLPRSAFGWTRISRGWRGASIRIAEPDENVGRLDEASARAIPIASISIVAIRAARRCPSARSECHRATAALRYGRGSSLARSVTMARSSPAIALIRLDFPAFGGPATTTFTPSFSGSTRGRSSHDRSSAASAPQAR